MLNLDEKNNRRIRMEMSVVLLCRNDGTLREPSFRITNL